MQVFTGNSTWQKALANECGGVTYITFLTRAVIIYQLTIIEHSAISIHQALSLYKLFFSKGTRGVPPKLGWIWVQETAHYWLILFLFYDDETNLYI